MSKYLVTPALASVLLLAACATTPADRDEAPVALAVSQAGVGGPRLPVAGEGYPDPAWLAAPLTVEAAVQAALLNNPRVRAELTRLDAAQAERVQAGLLRNPMGSLMLLRPQGGGRVELDYGLMQSLFDLFTRSRRIGVADAAQRRIEAEVVGQLVALCQDAEAAYYDALVAAAELRTRREQLALDQQLQQLLQAQASQGAAAATAVLEQQANAASRAHEVHMAEARLAQARAALAQSLGLASSERLRLPDAFPDLAVPGLDAPALQALAAAHRAELKAAAASEAQQRAERALQVGTLRATEPSAGPAGVRESSGMSLKGLDLQLALPIFDSGRARRELADARVAQAGFSAETLRRQVPLEVERALAMLLAARDAADHAGQHVERQMVLERLAQRTYRQGASDRPAYLRARQARLLAELDQIQARQVLATALVALERATGVALARVDPAPRARPGR